MAETETSESDVPTKKRAPRHSKKNKSATDCGENLAYYSEDWVAILVEAQQRWQRHLILGRAHPFPQRGSDLHEAHDILTYVISEHLNDGQLLDDSQ